MWAVFEQTGLAVLRTVLLSIYYFLEMPLETHSNVLYMGFYHSQSAGGV